MTVQLALPVLVLATCGLTLSLLIVTLEALFKSKSPKDDLIVAVNDLLPQTQCAQCGYPGCRPYAEAVIAGENFGLCIPGGEKTRRALASLLDRDLGSQELGEPTSLLARVREAECIGCGLCFEACPVDAIVGAPQFSHTVLESHCTGCELCVPPCPVDCIDLVANK